tara:strand:+ start:98 stop:1114 length:1017 start_codon:yes stop_codon:yes gene_type:complete
MNPPAPNLDRKGKRNLPLILALILALLFIIYALAALISAFRNEEISLMLGLWYGAIIGGTAIAIIVGTRKERAAWRDELKKEDQNKQRILERAKELKGQRLSLDRQNHLQKSLFLYRKLPNSLKPKLEERILLFQEIVEFRTSSKFKTEITQQIKDIISAEACLLTVNRSPTDYLHLKQVELWDSPIIGPEDFSFWNKSRAGEAGRDMVRIDLRHLEASVNEGDDNYNIVLHEFAHVLDFADDRIANSIPVSKDSNEYARWKALLDLEYPKLKKAHRKGLNPVLREYAVSDFYRGEFFPCATESFFERSVRLKKEDPEIYYLLKDFYILDPAEWIEGQ